MVKGQTNKDLKDKKDKKDNQSESSGDREIKLVMPHRHRRDKTTDTFSKGQKKRLMKKARQYKRIEFASKLEEQNKHHKEKEKDKKDKKEKNFYFNNIDKEIDNLINLEEEMKQQNKKNTSQVSNCKHRKNRINNLIENEQDKIIKVLNNKVFQANPREAMNNHIYNSLLIEKRKKQMQENFDKSLSNISNIKK